MYAKVKSCVRSDNDLTKLFAYKRGLRQGCLLSPLLFALFLNDLNNFLLDGAEGITLWDTRLCAMLYADDIILGAESSADLQAQMDLLGIYANNLKMEISQKKTKVLVFRKSSARSNRVQKIWSIGDIFIDEAKSYKYLGVTIKADGSFTEHVSLIRDKATKAYFSIIAKNKEWQGLNPKVFLHVFDHTVLPILNYDAEVWGNNPWNELENLHLQACKYTLGVHQSTPTDGVYSELGRYPLYVYRKISIIKYLKRLEGLSNERLAKKAFNQLKQNHDNNHYNWVSQAFDSLEEYNVLVTDCHSKIKYKIKESYKNKLKQNLISCIDQHKKLRTYARFKTAIKFEDYLETIHTFTIRRCFTRFRLGVHDLEIEHGRFRRKPLPIESRICKLCQHSIKAQVVEDEEHFLLYCLTYNSHRCNMLAKISMRTGIRQFGKICLTPKPRG